MVDATALTRLVGEAAGFLDAEWGRLPRYVAAADRHVEAAAVAGEAGGERDIGLLTIEDVDRLVAGSGLRIPSFRLVKQGKTLPQARVTRRVRIGSRPVSDLIDPAAVHREVADGATLVLQGLHRSFPPVAAFCRDLERTLTHPVQANAYLTPPVAQGLNLHEDPHDVFAVQRYGTKRWVVHPPDGGAAWDLSLQPDDVLYLPAGTRHAAQTVGEPSLHLTLGVRTISWRQVVEQAVTEAMSTIEPLDRPLPVSWAEHPDVLEDEVATLLATVAERLADRRTIPDAVHREADRFWSSRPVDRTGGLLDILTLDQMDDRARLRRRDGVIARVATADTHGGVAADRVEVVLADRRLSLPAAVAPAVQHVLDAGRLQPRDLDDHLDVDSRLVLCRRLIREGLLQIDRAGA